MNQHENTHDLDYIYSDFNIFMLNLLEIAGILAIRDICFCNYIFEIILLKLRETKRK